MLTVKEIANELDSILNGTSPNIPEEATRPFDGVFSVKTAGYHLDHVYDPKTKSNFFPVFMENGTGEFNPIKDLEQVDYSFPVSIYFPVRFKDKMLAMQEYLVKCFVGQNPLFSVYGDDGKIAYKQGGVTNISAFELGEITDLDLDQYGQSLLKQLNAYISEQYKLPVNTMEPWISLNFTLYVSTMKNANAKDGYVYGNAFKEVLTITRKKSDGTLEDLSEEVKTDSTNLTYTASTSSQQGFEIGGKADSESSSLPLTNARGTGFEAVIKDNEFWNYLLSMYSTGKLSSVPATLEVKSRNGTTLTGLNLFMEVTIVDFRVPISLGSPLSATFNLVKKAVVNNGEQ